MAFCRLHDEYWVVNLESLGLDTLSNTETSKPCIISKRGLVVHKLDILLSYKSLSGPPFWTGALGLIPVTLIKASSHLTIFMRAKGEIQKNNYHHGQRGPSFVTFYPQRTARIAHIGNYSFEFALCAHIAHENRK